MLLNKLLIDFWKCYDQIRFFILDILPFHYPFWIKDDIFIFNNLNVLMIKFYKKLFCYHRNVWDNHFDIHCIIWKIMLDFHQLFKEMFKRYKVDKQTVDFKMIKFVRVNFVKRLSWKLWNVSHFSIKFINSNYSWWCFTCLTKQYWYITKYLSV